MNVDQITDPPSETSEISLFMYVEVKPMKIHVEECIFITGSRQDNLQLTTTEFEIWLICKIYYEVS